MKNPCMMCGKKKARDKMLLLEKNPTQLICKHCGIAIIKIQIAKYAIQEAKDEAKAEKMKAIRDKNIARLNHAVENNEDIS